MDQSSKPSFSPSLQAGAEWCKVKNVRLHPIGNWRCGWLVRKTFLGVLAPLRLGVKPERPKDRTATRPEAALNQAMAFGQRRGLSHLTPRRQDAKDLAVKW